MSDERPPVAPLTREGLFRLIADEVCRDGILEPFEKDILEVMAPFLRLEREEARNIVLAARDRFQAGVLGTPRPLDPRALYAKALEFARADGRIDRLEDQMLTGLRKLFQLSDEDHAAIQKSLPPPPVAEAPPPVTPTIAAPGVPEAPPAAETPPPRPPATPPAPDRPATPGTGASSPPAPPPHRPGVGTAHLAARLETDPQNAWFREHCFWFNALRQASPPARAAWDDFLGGLETLDEATMYRGLDALDDILNSLEGVSLADVLLALGALRWARVLLKTTYAPDGGAEARDWPGQPLYQRLAVKMGPILITIDHLRVPQKIEEGLALAFAGLMEDLCLVIERRQAEPIRLLGVTIAQLVRVFPKSKITFRGADLLPPLADRVARQGGAVRDGFVGLCREFCGIQPQNHPLAAAAHRALLDLAPDQLVFPPDFRPRGTNAPNPTHEPALQRLDRLIKDACQREESERLLAEALGTADLSAVVAVREAAIQASHGSGLPPDVALARQLVALLLPEPAGYPRPVVAFFALGGAGGHHEELKGGWIQVLLKPLDDGRLQVVPDFPFHPSTSVLSIPLDQAGSAALEAALHRSGGAYDVALVDPGHTGSRIWHQVGDLDPSGRLFRVEEALLRADRPDEADRALDEALARFPWLSRAWVHKGLIAKRAGRLAEARQAFTRALEVQPHDPSALTRLGVLDKNENAIPKAEEVLRRSLKILPTDPSAIVTVTSLALGRLAGGESGALPLWDYYVAGLHAVRGDGRDFQEIAGVGDNLDRGLARKARTIPVDWGFYL
ncbi:MAG: tetratricopeptide repeat protein [Candidatus Riflebacteria bacterium]|nr:tetratricopeptide repeat protein [Candidatus Riflebacteria bacterium]